MLKLLITLHQSLSDNKWAWSAALLAGTTPTRTSLASTNYCLESEEAVRKSAQSWLDLSGFTCPVEWEARPA